MLSISYSALKDLSILLTQNAKGGVGKKDKILKIFPSKISGFRGSAP